MALHQDSFAAVTGGAITAAALGAGAFYCWAKFKMARAVACVVAALVALATGAYLSFAQEDRLDQRDHQASAAVRTAGFEVIEVTDGDIRVRTKMPSGKMCEATFSLTGWDAKALPFPEGSGRNPSKGCGIDKLEDFDGSRPFQDDLTEQEKALAKIFAPKR